MSDPTLGYLGAGFAVAWLVLAIYFVHLGRVQRNIARRLDDIEARRKPPENEGV